MAQPTPDNSIQPSLRASLLHIFAASLLVTVLNAIKPPIVDDGLYIDLARHISTHFIDPYGFNYLWFQWEEPAIRVTSPLLVPYWLAICIRFFGDNYVVLKIWMWPWAAIMAGSLWSLLTRWAPREREPLFWMTLLSAFMLPAINLMLDFPTTALVLASLWAMTRAVDRSSVKWSLLAGLVGGLAMQAKFTGFIAPILLFLYGAVFLRVGLGAIGASVAVAVFSLWEYVLIGRYGRSFFVESLGGQSELAAKIPPLMQGMVTVMGLLGAGTGLTALRLIRPSPWIMGIASIGLLSPFFLVPWIGIPPAMAWILGLAIWGGAAMAVAPGVIRIVREVPGGGPVRWFLDLPESKRTHLFLLLWLGVEVFLYFAISPFPAARRLIGITLVLMFLMGNRLCEVDAPPREAQPRSGWMVAIAGVLAGMMVAAADIQQAWQYRRGFDLVAARIVQSDSDPTHRVFYIATWSAKYDGPRTGMIEARPEETRIKAGDWLMVATRGIDAPLIRVTPQDAKAAFEIDIAHPWHVNTLGYFSGLYPFFHNSGPIGSFTVVQARRDFLLRSQISAGQMEAYARSTRFVAPPASIMVLADGMLSSTPEIRDLLAGKIAATGPRVYTRLLSHPDPRIRRWVLSMLNDQPLTVEESTAVKELLLPVANLDPDPAVREEAIKWLNHPK